MPGGPACPLRRREWLPPAGDATRPTADRVREALFSALDAMPSSLTATVLRGQGETTLPLAVSQELRARAEPLLKSGYGQYLLGLLEPEHG